jgi:hypothetical protein
MSREKKCPRDKLSQGRNVIIDKHPGTKNIPLLFKKTFSTFNFS